MSVRTQNTIEQMYNKHLSCTRGEHIGHPAPKVEYLDYLNTGARYVVYGCILVILILIIHGWRIDMICNAFGPNVLS